MYFLRLGATGFGGPVALVGYMQRDLVEERGWISAEEFANGVALAQMAPGPLAAQLAMYLGWVRGRAWGATLCGTAFVLAPFLIVLALAAGYAAAGELPWIRRAFVGVGAAVICVVARSALKLSKLTLAKNASLWVIALANAAAVLAWQRESVTLLLLSGMALLAWRHSFSVAGAAGLIPPITMRAAPAVFAYSKMATLFIFFAKAGAAVFGSGLAIIPFLYTGAVQQYGWLTEQQFLDAIAVSMITPGPVVITATFIGYLVAGAPGGTIAALGVFLPPYIIVLLVAPRFGDVLRNPRIRTLVDGITAAATGAIIGAALLLGYRMLSSVTAVGIAGVVLVLMLTRVRVPEPALIISAGIVSALIG
jgi:chromate transporter